VLPGLIDTHHHFLQNLLKGSRDDLSFVEWIRHVSSPRIVLAVQDYLAPSTDAGLAGEWGLQHHATRIGCIEALKSGITCILNMEWATPPGIIQVYEETGIRAVHVLTMTDVDQWQESGMLLPEQEMLELADRLIARCRVSQGGRVTFRYGPACENSASTELIKRVRELANQNKVGIHIHMAESKFGWDNIHQVYGKTPVGYLNSLGLLGPDVLGAHAIWLSDEDIYILKDTGTSVSYNPECHMKIALGIAPVVKMLEAGVNVSLGTDTCAVNDNMDLFEAMRVGAFLQKLATMNPAVVPAYQALEMATIGGARSLGMDNEIGSLEVGKKADMILVDLTGVHMRPINNIANNLVYCTSAASDVETVIVDGQLVVQDHRLLCCDEQKTIAEAEEFALQRFARAGLDVPFYYGGVKGGD
jgi:5-methylthioadenosine/S-adenosylhomocysteine deaminase